MEEKHENFIAAACVQLGAAVHRLHSGGEKMRNASGQVKMSGSEEIKANISTGNKIFGNHIRQFLLKNNV